MMNEIITYGIVLLLSLSGSFIRDILMTLNPKCKEDEKIRFIKIFSSAFVVSIILFFFGSKLSEAIGLKPFLGTCFFFGMISYNLSIALTNPKKMGSFFKLFGAIRKGALSGIGDALEEISEEDKVENANKNKGEDKDGKD